MARALKGFVSSLNSDNGLYHQSGLGCHFAARILPENALKFKSRERAEKRGLRMCRNCAQLAKQRRLLEYG